MPNTPEQQPARQKHCFVVMGFGTKTDLATGRNLNLDKSYNALIKPAVEAKGWTCVRADEIPHSNLIDVEMYRQLLIADVVIADLSTSNANAFYELGVRYALRPRNTIVISEEQLSYPFNLNHIPISKYKTLGDNIDYFEVLRFQKALEETLDSIINNDVPDSPVYTFLNGLIPPSLRKKAEQQMAQQAAGSGGADTPGAENNTMYSIVRLGETALKNMQYSDAKDLFKTALTLSKNPTEQNIAAGNNAYLVHRLAYATYKARLPDKVSALKEAITILEELDLDHTNDTETVTLAGKIEKRLYFNGEGLAHLDAAILYQERAWYLLNNSYNGINLAFLLNNRVDTTLLNSDQERLTDMVMAGRIRRQVIIRCDAKWNNLVEKSAAVAGAYADVTVAADQQEFENEQKFWIQVNKAEAYYGLGDKQGYETAYAAAKEIPHTDDMMQRFTEQRDKLKLLMEKHGQLLNPPWLDSLV